MNSIAKMQMIRGDQNNVLDNADSGCLIAAFILRVFATKFIERETVKQRYLSCAQNAGPITQKKIDYLMTVFLEGLFAALLLAPTSLTFFVFHPVIQSVRKALIIELR